MDDKNKRLVAAIAAQKQTFSSLKAEKSKSDKLATEERSARYRADAQTKHADDLAYDANMNLIQSSRKTIPISTRVRELLEKTPWKQRRFEWYYWDKTFSRVERVRGIRRYLRPVDHRTVPNGMVVALSADGTSAATGDLDGARMFDTRTGRTTLVFGGHTGPVSAIALSRDGRNIATGGPDGIRIWDARTGQRTCFLPSDPYQKSHKLGILAVAFSDDGKTIVTASSDSVRVWDAKSGRCIRIIKDRLWFSGVALSPDGRTFVTGTEGQTTKIWDVNSGETTQILKTYAPFESVLSQDGTTVVTGQKDGTHIWDAKTGKIAHVLRVAGVGGPRVVTVASDGRTVVTGEWDGTVRVWDVDQGQTVLILNAHKSVASVALSRDGSTIMAVSSDDIIWIWPAKLDLNTALKGHIGPVALTNDGRIVAIGGDEDGDVQTWDAKEGRVIQVLKGHTDWVSSVAFARGDGTIVTGSQDGTVRIWDTKAGRTSHTLRDMDIGRAVAVSKDGRIIATTAIDTTARIWDADTGKTTIILKGHTARVASVALSQDGRTVITGSSDGTTRVWNARTGLTTAILKGHSGPVSSVALSPDGLTAITGSYDDTARIWDVKKGTTTAILKGHTGAVLWVALSPDGRTMVTAGFDNTTRVWDGNTGQTTLMFKGYGGPIAFSEDGRTIVTASQDGTARIWDGHPAASHRMVQ